jgi:hypothetical protein
MNIRLFLSVDWRHSLMKILRTALVQREQEEKPGWDPADDEEVFEETLLAIFPPDGRDGRRKDKA